MAFAFVQQKAATLATAASSISVQLDTSTVQGNALIISVYKSANKSVAISDGGKNNTYTLAGTASGTVFIDFFYALNANSGRTTFTATETGGSDVSAIYVAEYSGLATSNALLGSAFQSQSAPGSGVDAVTSGTSSITLTAGGALVWGFTYDAPGTSNNTTGRGTGFSARTNVWGTTWLGNNGNPSGFPEDKRVTASGSYAATFRASAATANDTYYTGLLVLSEPTGQLSGQTVTTKVGSIGEQTAAPLTSQSITSALGTPTYSTTLSLGSTSATFVEGIIVNNFTLVSQTATFTEGVITAQVSGDVSVDLGAQTIGLSQGAMVDVVSYILDQNTLNIVGQTSTFSLGVIVATPTYAVTGQTVTSSEGVISDAPSVQLGAETITSAEGIITASSPSFFTGTFTSQALTSSEGVISAVVNESLTAQTVTSAEGVITFSATSDVTLSLGAVAAVFAEGQIGITGPPQGTGPPLFIPPELGKPVTTRTFSWLEMASRAWGSEFRAPDHRIYQFSGGNYKDSTDLGQTGIYSPNLGPQDNP